MNKFSLLGVFAVMGCCFLGEKTEQSVTVASPDGRNEIRLWTDPLAYEVARDGEVVVAKSEIGMKVDGESLSTLKRSGDRFPVWGRRSLAGAVETPVYKKARVRLSGNETFADFGNWWAGEGQPQTIQRNDTVSAVVMTVDPSVRRLRRLVARRLRVQRCFYASIVNFIGDFERRIYARICQCNDGALAVEPHRPAFDGEGAVVTQHC